MTKSNASKKSNAQRSQMKGPTCDASPETPLLAGPKTPEPLKTDIDLTKVFDGLKHLSEDTSVSTARYLTFNPAGAIGSSQSTVCFHAISSYCASAQGLAICFQGYGGFRNAKTPEERWRPAIESDLYTNIEYPFVNIDQGHYNEVSLQWLECILNPDGPFKSLLPLMAYNTPEECQRVRGFIFPDVSLIPARLTWCFAIASRLGYANARVVWRYLHLLNKGLDKRTALLIAGGFEHEVVKGNLTGKIIKSYTAGFLGADVTAYAGRMLSANPIQDPPFKDKKIGTYGSSEVFKSGKIDLSNLRFDNWDDVIAYTQKRGVEQSAELKLQEAA